MYVRIFWYLYTCPAFSFYNWKLSSVIMCMHVCGSTCIYYTSVEILNSVVNV